PLEQFGLNADLVLAATGGHLPLLLEDRAHCVAAELQTARDLAYAHALLVEQKHRFALVRFDHGVSSRCRKKLAAGSRSRPSANSPGRERPESSACGPRSCPSPAACISRCVRCPSAAPVQTRRIRPRPRTPAASSPTPVPALLV